MLLINPPGDYFEILQADLRKQLCKKGQTPDFVHLFATSQKEFESEMKKLNVFKKKNTNIIIWVSWYKKSAGRASDMNEDIIRNFALKNGLVDVKVCAVSDEWSGLKLVVPLKLRGS